MLIPYIWITFWYPSEVMGSDQQIARVPPEPILINISKIYINAPYIMPSGPDFDLPTEEKQLVFETVELIAKTE